MPYPSNYRYTREHEWIEVTDSIGAIGITDYAQASLGDIVYVDAPKVGDPVTATVTFGSVESVKAVARANAQGARTKRARTPRYSKRARNLPSAANRACKNGRTIATAAENSRRAVHTLQNAATPTP